MWVARLQCRETTTPLTLEYPTYQSMIRPSPPHSAYCHRLLQRCRRSAGEMGAEVVWVAHRQRRDMASLIPECLVYQNMMHPEPLHSTD